MDATLIPVAKQRNTREENKEIKAGRLPKGREENPDRLRQKDFTATRTASASMSILVLSADMPLLQRRMTIARCFRSCLIPRMNMRRCMGRFSLFG